MIGKQVVSDKQEEFGDSLCVYLSVYVRTTSATSVILPQVCEKILNGAELEFYKWDGDIKEFLAGVKTKLNKVAEVIMKPGCDFCYHIVYIYICIYIHTYIHTYIIYTYIHTYVHTYIIYTYIHTYICYIYVCGAGVLLNNITPFF